MSTLSQHLGMTLNADSDPFQRTDIVGNFSILDQYPGAFICTSSSRPTWGANQAGQMILETDTRRIIHWNGSGWHEIQATAPGWYGSISPAATISGGNTVTYNIFSLTATRPGTLVVWIQSNIHTVSNRALGFGTVPQIDGANSALFGGSTQAYQQAPASQAGTGLFNDYRVTTCMGIRAVSAGTHTVGCVISVPSGVPASAGQINNVAAFAQLVNTTDT